MKQALLIGSAAFLLSGCIGDILNTKPEVRGLEGAAPIQTLTNPTSPTDVTLRPGGKLVVRIASNPTTGYYWSQVAGNEAIVALISEGFLADPVPDGVAGSGGTQEFTFDAIRKGRTEIVLSYKRHESDVADTLNLKVKVIE